MEPRRFEGEPIKSSEFRESAAREKELSEQIRAVELDDSSKEQIILLWKGLKVAGEVAIPPEDEGAKQRLETLLNNLGLSYSELQAEHKDFAHLGEDMRRYAISREESGLARIKAALLKSTTDDRELGALYGFPPTAVEEFAAGRNLISWNLKELPREVKKEPHLAFVQFILSKDNWQAELETAKAWAEAVKSVDPELYQRIVQGYQERSL